VLAQFQAIGYDHTLEPGADCRRGHSILGEILKKEAVCRFCFHILQISWILLNRNLTLLRTLISHSRQRSEMEKRTADESGSGGGGMPAVLTATTPAQKKRLEVLKQFRVLLRSIKRHYQWVEQECGMSGAQLWAMAEIADAPGIKVSDLARQLGVHLSTASNMLRRLEELGLVKRIRIGKDHRVVQLQLTAKGAKILKRAPRPFVGILQQALAELPQRRLDSLHAELGEVVRLMKFKDSKARVTPLSEI
jgi:DNA-binding MarR family transcriptional regulator